MSWADKVRALTRIAGCVVVGLMVLSAAAEPTSKTDERLRLALGLYPDADTNKDGILTETEARAYLQKRQTEKPPPAGKTGDARLPLPKVPGLAAGQRVFVCGHSFHVFIAQPLGQLAAEAKLAKHKLAGEQFIGGSNVLQHWQLPDEKNKAKAALTSGKVDVLTLSPHSLMPDDGINQYVALAVRNNPQVRVFLQLSWVPYDGTFGQKFQRQDYDRLTREQLDNRVRPLTAAYRNLLAIQVNNLNKPLKRQVVFMVPVAEAVCRLRELVIAQKLPGVSRQSDLYTDGMGHPGQLTRDLVSYCWFAAIYRRSPVGLTAFVKPDDVDSAKQQRLLQEIAWDVVQKEPMSGVAPGGSASAGEPSLEP